MVFIFALPTAHAMYYINIHNYTHKYVCLCTHLRVCTYSIARMYMSSKSLRVNLHTHQRPIMKSCPVQKFIQSCFCAKVTSRPPPPPAFAASATSSSSSVAQTPAPFWRSSCKLQAGIIIASEHSCLKGQSTDPCLRHWCLQQGSH